MTKIEAAQIILNNKKLPVKNTQAYILAILTIRPFTGVFVSYRKAAQIIINEI